MNGSPLVTALTGIALALLMVSMGMQVSVAEVISAARPLRRVAIAIVANYVLVPAITLGLLYFFAAEPMVAAGLLILAVCPAAPIGPPATAIAKGNVPSSIGLMVVLAGLSAILSPLMFSVLLRRVATEGELAVDYLAIVRSLMVVQMLPLAAGLTFHHFKPALAKRLVRPVGLVATLLLLVLMGLIVAGQHDMIAVIRPRGWCGMCVLFVASLAIGWVCGGTDLGIRKALSLTTAARNAAVGLAIATSNFPNTPALTAVVAYGGVSIVATFGCAALMGRFMPASAPVG